MGIKFVIWERVNTVFDIISVISPASAHIQVFIEFFLTALCKIFFLSYWLLSNITNVKTMDSSERGIDPVAMTINHKGRPSVPKSCTLTTEQWGPASLTESGSVMLPYHTEIN